MLSRGSGIGTDPQHYWAWEILTNLDSGSQMQRAERLYERRRDCRKQVISPPIRLHSGCAEKDCRHCDQITATGVVTVTGSDQTEPGHAGNLKVQAKPNGLVKV